MILTLNVFIIDEVSDLVLYVFIVFLYVFVFRVFFIEFRGLWSSECGDLMISMLLIASFCVVFVGGSCIGDLLF